MIRDKGQMALSAERKRSGRRGKKKKNAGKMGRCTRYICGIICRAAHILSRGESDEDRTDCRRAEEVPADTIFPGTGPGYAHSAGGDPGAVEAPAAPPGGQGAPEAGREAGAGPGGVRTVGHAGVGRPGAGRDGGVLPRHGAGGGPGRADRGAYPAGGGYGGPAGGARDPGHAHVGSEAVSGGEKPSDRGPCRRGGAPGGAAAGIRRPGPGGCARARTGSGHPFCALRRRRCQDRGPVREQPPDGSFFLCPAGTDPAGGL